MYSRFLWPVLASSGIAIVLDGLSHVDFRSLAGILYVVVDALFPVLCAFLLVGLAAGIHRLIKRKPMPGLTPAIWVAWAVLDLLLQLDKLTS